MTQKAHAFKRTMVRTWEGLNKGEENAVALAERQCAKRLMDCTVPNVWKQEPGDVPFGLWEWSDGSRYCIANDGSAIHAAYGRGRPHNPEYVPAVVT